MVTVARVRPPFLYATAQSAHQPVAVVSIQIDFRIVGPALFACFWVQSDHAIKRRREMERSIHENRRGLKAAALPAISPLGNVPG